MLINPAPQGRIVLVLLLVLCAWEPAKPDLRTFALHRLTRPQLTTEKFTKPKNFDPAELLRGSLNVSKAAKTTTSSFNSTLGPPTKSATAAGTPPNKSPISPTAGANSTCVYRASRKLNPGFSALIRIHKRIRAHP